MSGRISHAVFYALKDVLEGRMTQSQAARHYGVAVSSVHRAVKRAKKTPPPAAKPAEET
jgi:transposase-like protein